MKICILGWYGTETLGDRAILDGIFYILNKTYQNFTVSIGSLNTNFTHRTIIEDGDIYCTTAPTMDLKYFNAKSVSELTKEVNSSDLVVMGGGPIMDDIEELLVVFKGFKLARKKNIKTMIFGCGLGPLNNKKYIDIADNLLEITDLIVFRDETSCFTAKRLFFDKFNCYYSHDPAILSVFKYLNEKKTLNRNNNIALNLRKFPEGTYGVTSNMSKDVISKMIEKLSYDYDNVLLVPMHTYYIGGDDRKYLTEVSYNLERKNIKVIHKTMNIHQLYDVFHESHACIGMRYHSVLLQTLLNGNNYILDYTNKNIGKISSFIKMVDNNNFYENRYINIQDTIDNNLWKELNVLKENDRFKYDDDIFLKTTEFYVSKISKEMR